MICGLNKHLLSTYDMPLQAPPTALNLTLIAVFPPCILCVECLLWYTGWVHRDCTVAAEAHYVVIDLCYIAE